MPTVLHFRNTFLRPSETFIARVINHHQRYEPVALCVHREVYCEGIPVEVMGNKLPALIKNGIPFLRGQSPPYINAVIEKYQPALIHAHFGQDAYLMIPTSRQLGLPLVTSFYGKDVTELPMRRIWRRRYRQLAEHGHAFIAASERMHQQLIDLGFPEAKIHIVKFGVDLNRIPFAPAASPKQRLMIVGRFVEKKGIEYALQAVGRLKDDFPNLHLDVYGEGERRGAYEKLIENLGIQERITLQGLTDNDEVLKQMTQHDVLLVPSVTAKNNDQEGMPNVILEGMASGIPVIGSRHAAIPEVVLHEETGLLVPERDALALCQAIQRVLVEQALRQEIIARAYELTNKTHNIRKNVLLLEQVYKRLSPSSN